MFTLPGLVGAGIAAGATAGTSYAAKDVLGPNSIPTKDLSTGQILDCSSIWNELESACWGLSSNGQPLDSNLNVDCSQFQNVINGSCSMLNFMGQNPLGTGISLGALALGVLVLVVLIKV